MQSHWGTLVLACVAQFMVILDVSVVNVALPSIRTGLDFSQQNLQWVVNAYTLTFAGFLLLGGRATDLLGRRRVFIGGLLLLSVASLVGGFAQSEGVLIAARALQGLGGAIVSPASLAIITTTFTEASERNRALGAWAAMGAAGGATGVLLGGVLTETLGWRWILFITIPIGVAAAVLALRFVAEGRNPRATRNFDLAGATTVTLGLVAIVWAVVRTEVNGWGSAETLGVLALGLLLIGVFLLIEGKLASAPLMPLRLFSSRTLTAANLIVLALGAAMFGMWYFMSLYLQQVLGYSPIEAGLSFLPMPLSILIFSTLASRAVARVGVKPLLVAGMLLQAIGLLLFTGIAPDGSYFPQVFVPGVLVASGMGMAFAPVTIAAVGGVDSSEAGLASGLVNTSRQMGGALGLAILATLATSQTSSELADGFSQAHALTDGFHRAFEVGAGFALVGALVALVGLPSVRVRRAAAQREAARAEASA